MELDETRRFWKKACDFPADKEAVYPTHALAHEFDEQAKGRVLEYGCGGGSDTISIIKRGGYVFFVDVVPENVHQTRARVAEHAVKKITIGGVPLLGGVQGHERGLGTVLEHSDVLPFEDSLFDSVNCHGVLHHIPEPTMDRVIAEFHRVLRPGGHLYAMLYTEVLRENGSKPVGGMISNGMSEERAFGMFTDGGGIARWYTEVSGRALFESHGFEFVKATEYVERQFRTFKLKRPT